MHVQDTRSELFPTQAPVRGCNIANEVLAAGIIEQEISREPREATWTARHKKEPRPCLLTDRVSSGGEAPRVKSWGWHPMPGWNRVGSRPCRPGLLGRHERIFQLHRRISTTPCRIHSSRIIMNYSHCDTSAVLNICVSFFKNSASFGFGRIPNLSSRSHRDQTKREYSYFRY